MAGGGNDQKRLSGPFRTSSHTELFLLCVKKAFLTGLFSPGLLSTPGRRRNGPPFTDDGDDDKLLLKGLPWAQVLRSH